MATHPGLAQNYPMRLNIQRESYLIHINTLDPNPHITSNHYLKTNLVFPVILPTTVHNNTAVHVAYFLLFAVKCNAMSFLYCTNKRLRFTVS